MNDCLLEKDSLKFSRYDNLDLCNECNSQVVRESCNRCGEGVCLGTNCCLTFPHYKDTLFVVCLDCSKQIESKLKVLIEKDDLKLLKQRIKLGKTKSF